MDNNNLTPDDRRFIMSIEFVLMLTKDLIYSKIPNTKSDVINGDAVIQYLKMKQTHPYDLVAEFLQIAKKEYDNLNDERQ